MQSEREGQLCQTGGIQPRSYVRVCLFSRLASYTLKRSHRLVMTGLLIVQYWSLEHFGLTKHPQSDSGFSIGFRV